VIVVCSGCARSRKLALSIRFLMPRSLRLSRVYTVCVDGNQEV
jgi:hypothetical protein